MLAIVHRCTDQLSRHEVNKELLGNLRARCFYKVGYIPVSKVILAIFDLNESKGVTLH